MTTGERLGNLEDFSTWRDGVRIKAADFNFWGVTFARDPTTFYATLRTAGVTYLVRGDLALRKLTVLRENIECPSLSPDNRRIAFKKRVGPASGAMAALRAGRRFHDGARDLDRAPVRRRSNRVARRSAGALRRATGRRRRGRRWVTPVDGSASPALFLPEAESPVVVR